MAATAIELIPHFYARTSADSEFSQSFVCLS